MTQESTQHKTYVKLFNIAERVIDGDHELTDVEKREFGIIVAMNMTPYRWYCYMLSTQNVWGTIWQNYNEMKDIEVARAYVSADDCVTIDEWTEANGRPLPDKAGMMNHLLDITDDVEYIDNNYDDILDFLPDQCEYNLNDVEIADLFLDYVAEPAEE